MWNDQLCSCLFTGNSLSSIHTHVHLCRSRHGVMYSVFVPKGKQFGVPDDREVEVPKNNVFHLAYDLCFKMATLCVLTASGNQWLRFVFVVTVSRSSRQAIDCQRVPEKRASNFFIKEFRILTIGKKKRIRLESRSLKRVRVNFCTLIFSWDELESWIISTRFLKTWVPIQASEPNNEIVMAVVAGDSQVL